MRSGSPHHGRLGLFALTTILVCLPLAGCGSGSDGAPGVPGSSTGILSGTVTNALAGTPLAGVPVTFNPAVAGTPAITAANGTYSVEVPVGAYSLTCAPTNFTSRTLAAGVVADHTTTVNFAMSPTSPVVVKITGAPGSPTPGQTFGLNAGVTPLDGSSVVSYHWYQVGEHAQAQEEGGFQAAAVIVNENTATPTVTLADAGQYKAALRSWVHTPERWEVLPISPFAMEEGTGVVIACDVTTTSGVYTTTQMVMATVPFATWSTGLRNVARGLPVLMNGKTQATYDWTLTTVPAGSAAVMQDAGTVNPWFVPDVQGRYVVSVTALPGATLAVQIPVFAGDWWGGLQAIDDDGQPTTTTCTSTCHATLLRETFDEWAQTGHAHIFTTQVNTGGHYGPGCFACHTVGYDTTVANAGMDDAPDYAAFLAGMFPGGFSHPDPDNMETVLTNWPQTALRTNIQCENCHGPNGASTFTGVDAHGFADLANNPDDHPRVSLRSDVCGYCHGEPPRHARFQQWQGSGHGNYELAQDEGTSTSCARCHVVEGFLTWLPRLQAGNSGSLVSGDITWTAETVHPVTCVACHDPHAVGTTSGHGSNAPMRVEGSVPENPLYVLPSGYRAANVGKGAMCITCHNTRNGTATSALAAGPDRAPHSAAQGDVLLGKNAFFTPEYRGPHGFLEDTCVTCHLELTPPPEDLSYQLGGTNHTFGAELEICSDCHGEFDGGTIQEQFHESLAMLETEIEKQIKAEIVALVAKGHFIDLRSGTGGSSTLVVTINGANVGLIQEIQVVEPSGRFGMDITINGVLYEGIQLHQEVRINGVTNSSLVSNAFYPSADTDLAKCGWNYFLMHGDGSEGLHNPTFQTNVISATMAVLQAMNWTLP